MAAAPFMIAVDKVPSTPKLLKKVVRFRVRRKGTCVKMGVKMGVKACDVTRHWVQITPWS